MSSASAIQSIMTRAPVIPVLAIDEVEVAVDLARALVDGGLPVLEVTLRTDAALAAVEAIAEALPQATVGVGTVISAGQVASAQSAGARFVVSPGFTASVAVRAQQLDLPLLPGVMTPSEVMAAVEAGLDHLKFFPATAAGGADMLKALAGPFPQARFCPTGGITADNHLSFLRLANVLCVGGSWLAPADAVAARDWPRIRALAAAVSGQRSPSAEAGGVGDRWYSVAGEEDPGSAFEDLR
ncbi:bifunctional 4-hydroxy-2-oxoglutarate aldolase/2-dehydro-3-deoxy-phosphogluconate aldolase [Spiribacter pallidus]|uniref:2-dehydro-3-deoxy-phosphogluconate aldolase n=1 Tax=Spiribacter pallidus TaxID=1987936 RepID=A0ABV3TCI6_9GAMM